MLDIFAALRAIFGVDGCSRATATVRTESGSTYRIDMGGWNTTWTRTGRAYNGLSAHMGESCFGARLERHARTGDRVLVLLKADGTPAITTSKVVKVTIG